MSSQTLQIDQQQKSILYLGDISETISKKKKLYLNRKSE